MTKKIYELKINKQKKSCYMLSGMSRWRVADGMRCTFSSQCLWRLQQQLHNQAFIEMYVTRDILQR